MGAKRAFLRSKMDKNTFFPVNDRNVHAMSLEICFFGVKRYVVTYVVTFNSIYARWGPKKAFLR